MPYTAHRHNPVRDADELRARIPGWGVDSAPEDRPSWPLERFDLETGAHEGSPERQGDDPARERSIEHAHLTPVYGTAQPLHGVSGAVRRFAYSRFSEGQTAHWLLLIAGDRIEAAGAHARSLATRHPDNPLTQTGILAERRRGPIRSRFGRSRIDQRHTWLDPILVAGPWIVAGWIAWRVVRRVEGGSR